MIKTDELVYSRSGEEFDYDEELLDDLEDGDTYFVGTKTIIEPSDVITGYADMIAERIEEELYYYVGDIIVDYDVITQDKKDELDNLISNFLKKNLAIDVYQVVDIKECVFHLDEE